MTQTLRPRKYLLIKEFLVDGPEEPSQVLILAHGAGVGMAAPFMDFFARGVARADIRVVRFHFPYMEESVRTGRRRPPDGGRILRAAFAEVIEHCVGTERCPRDRLVIGGKSMGGRVATMIADEHRVAGVVCLGYPFHPPKKPRLLRTAHLAGIRTPVLICQGERDAFGTREELESGAVGALSPSVTFHWLPDGNHNLAPRKSSGRTEEENLQDAVGAITEFMTQPGGRL